MRAGITRQALSRQMEQSRGWLLEITRRWQRGLLSGADRARDFREEQERGFYGFLEESGLTLRLRPESWPRFAADYALWREGAPPVPAPSEPWLQCGGVEADPADKGAVLQLMDFYRLSPDLFRPCPDDCPQPELDLRPYGSRLSGLLRFRPVGNAGILEDPDPAGKACLLKDGRGLTVSLLVLRRATAEERRNNRISPELIAEGSIAGITAARVRKILVSRSNAEGVLLLETSLDSADLEAFREFPLWAEYRKWRQEQQRESEACLLALLRAYDAARSDTEREKTDNAGRDLYTETNKEENQKCNKEDAP